MAVSGHVNRGQFKLALSQFASKAKGNADQAVRKVILTMWERVTVRSPVDTGRFRHSWTYGVDMFPPAPVDVAAAASIFQAGRASNQRATYSPPSPPDIPLDAAGRVHWIVNHLPYARALEHGHSRQAPGPGGIVGRTVIEFKAIVDQAAQEVRQ